MRIVHDRSAEGAAQPSGEPSGWQRGEGSVNRSDYSSDMPLGSPGSLLPMPSDPVSATGGALPEPSTPPTSDDWAAYRPVFEDLYIAQKKTLRETMREMKERYGFQAR